MVLEQDDSKKNEESKLDEASAESFPASDAPAWHLGDIEEEKRRREAKRRKSGA